MNCTFTFLFALILFAALGPLFELRAANQSPYVIMKTLHVEQMTKQDWQNLGVKLAEETVDEIIRRKNSVDNPLTREAFLGSHTWDKEKYLKIGFKKWKELCGGDQPKFQFKLGGKVIPFIPSTTLRDRFKKGQPLLETARLKNDYSVTRQTLPPSLQRVKARTPDISRPASYRPFLHGTTPSFARNSYPYRQRYSAYANPIGNSFTSAVTTPITTIPSKHLPKPVLPAYQQRLGEVSPVSFLGKAKSTPSVPSRARDSEAMEQDLISTPTTSRATFSSDLTTVRSDMEPDLEFDNGDNSMKNAKSPSVSVEPHPPFITSAAPMPDEMKVDESDLNRKMLMQEEKIHRDCTMAMEEDGSMIANVTEQAICELFVTFDVKILLEQLTGRETRWMLTPPLDSLYAIYSIYFASTIFLLIPSFLVFWDLFEVVTTTTVFECFSFALKRLKSAISALSNLVTSLKLCVENHSISVSHSSKLK